MQWTKIASVTTGGKPFFYRAYDSQGNWLASVIWNRSMRAYAVEVLLILDNDVRTGRLARFASTVSQGKRFARELTGG